MTKKGGDEFIKSAIKNGAKAIVCHNIPQNYFENVTYILVNDSNDALSIISNNFYDFIWSNMCIILQLPPFNFFCLFLNVFLIQFKCRVTNRNHMHCKNSFL